MTAKRSVVLGCGSYLPQKVLTNAELAARIETSDEWIVQRTGIRQRHIAAEGEFTSHLAINAARAALEHAGIDAQAIDLIVLATSTPDNTFPATAVAVQNGLGIHHGAAALRHFVDRLFGVGARLFIAAPRLLGGGAGKIVESVGDLVGEGGDIVFHGCYILLETFCGGFVGPVSHPGFAIGD